ncbi:unnamed protein product [Musa banksii]
MSPKHEECHWNSFRNSIYTEKEKYEPSPNEIVVSSRSWTDVSTVNGMCSSLRHQSEQFVYKRRKLNRNSVALLPEEYTMESRKRKFSSESCNCSEDYLLGIRKADFERETVDFVTADVESVPSSGLCGICSVGKFEVPSKASDGKISKSAFEHRCNVNDGCSSSKSNVELTSTFLKIDIEDTGECSSSNVMELVGEFASARELCIYVLKTHGLLGKSCASSNYAASESLCDGSTNLSQKCKTCRLFDDPLKMLICDHCEEAYHPSCCIPRVKKLPVDEWYCQPCFKKKPKPLLSQSHDTEGENSNHTNRISCRGYSISFMLTDNKPYTSGARIGKDFQVEVPDCSGPVSNEDDYFDEPSEIDSAHSVNLNGWNDGKPQKPSSIGNWVQCREVLCSDGSDEGIVCGKWRRAPLFVVQSEDWDCSCSVLWDPFHADCAVPQELETEEVLKHLKFTKWLRSRLMAKSRNQLHLKSQLRR